MGILYGVSDILKAIGIFFTTGDDDVIPSIPIDDVVLATAFELIGCIASINGFKFLSIDWNAANAGNVFDL